MQIIHNYLRMYRREKGLTQEDVAFILDLKDFAQVSRWELGKRKSNIQTLLGYQLLLQIPLDILFERDLYTTSKRLQDRILMRISQLKAGRPDGHALKRILYLEDVLAKITTPTQGTPP